MSLAPNPLVVRWDLFVLFWGIVLVVLFVFCFVSLCGCLCCGVCDVGAVVRTGFGMFVFLWFVCGVCGAVHVCMCVCVC